MGSGYTQKFPDKSPARRTEIIKAGFPLIFHENDQVVYHHQGDHKKEGDQIAVSGQVFIGQGGIAENESQNEGQQDQPATIGVDG